MFDDLEAPRPFRTVTPLDIVYANTIYANTFEVENFTINNYTIQNSLVVNEAIQATLLIVDQVEANTYTSANSTNSTVQNSSGFYVDGIRIDPTGIPDPVALGNATANVISANVFSTKNLSANLFTTNNANVLSLLEVGNATATIVPTVQVQNASSYANMTPTAFYIGSSQLLRKERLIYYTPANGQVGTFDLVLPRTYNTISWDASGFGSVTNSVSIGFSFNGGSTFATMTRTFVYYVSTTGGVGGFGAGSDSITAAVMLQFLNTPLFGSSTSRGFMHGLESNNSFSKFGSIEVLQSASSTQAARVASQIYINSANAINAIRFIVQGGANNSYASIYGEW
jgi:hypothetical protein